MKQLGSGMLVYPVPSKFDQKDILNFESQVYLQPENIAHGLYNVYGSSCSPTT